MIPLTPLAFGPTTGISSVSDKFFVPKKDTTLTIDPVNDTLSGDDVTISGKLVDEDGNPVKGAEVTVTVDGESKTVTTDKNGKYNATFPTSDVGTKLVTVDYEGDTDYMLDNIRI